MVLLTAGSVLFVLLELFAAHHLAGVRYPLGRTGIYCVPLLTLLALALVKRWHVLTAPALLLALAFVIPYGLRWNARQYAEWGQDSALVRIATRIRSAQTSTKPVRISASHPLEQGLNFYSRKFRWRDWSEVKSLEERSPSEFRVLAPPDDALAAVNGWSVVYRDEATRILVVRE